MTEQLPELDPSDYEMDEETAALPVVNVEDVPERNPSDPDDEYHEQDDLDDSELEGLGAEDTQIWQRAVPRVRDKIQSFATNQVGFCLREIRIVNETEALALDAKESFGMCDSPHKITDFEKVPRGTIGYFIGGGSIHGHIYENLGNGYCGTTDLPTGHWGRIKAADLMARWGYEHAYWASQVNGHRVWAPTKQTPEPKPKPAPDPEYVVIKGAIKDLMKARAYHRNHNHPAVAAHLTRAIRELLDIPHM